MHDLVMKPPNGPAGNLELQCDPVFVGETLDGPGTLCVQAAVRFRRVAATAAVRARALGRPVLAWLMLPVSPVDLVTLFDRATQVADTRTLWEAPSERFGLVGIGSAWTVTTAGANRFAHAAETWRTVMDQACGDDSTGGGRISGPVGFGGFAFAPEPPTGGEWLGYPAGLLVLPRVSLVNIRDAGWLTVAAMIAPDGLAVDQDREVQACVRVYAEVLAGGAAGSGNQPEAADRSTEEFPSAHAWRSLVAVTTDTIRAGALQKVVLARGLRLRAAGFDPVGALRTVRLEYPDCTLFAVARGRRCFLGATPERLVRLHHGEMQVTALAGSVRRGASEDEDRRLGETLLRDPKDLTEHAIVVDALRETLSAVCARVSVPAGPVLLKMRNIQHLMTPMSGLPREGTTLLDLVGRLHPTPAVGGAPREAALQWIRSHEGWDRGWYAGPVGWVDRTGNGEFAVAIRSAVVSGADARLFAGCGIMAASDPDREYAESSLKLRPVLSALGVRGQEESGR